MPPNKPDFNLNKFQKKKEIDNVIGLFGLGFESGYEVPDVCDAI